MRCFNALCAVQILSLALAGCATKYQDMGFGGGVAAQQMSANVYRIEARGNGYTARNVVQDYMLLKAAETTKSSGNTHFTVVDQGDASTTASIVTPGSARTNIVGNTAYTSYSPATVTPIFKPGADAYIKVLTVPQGQQAPVGAISADEIIQYVGSRVQRG
jgi:hypothetical protein